MELILGRHVCKAVQLNADKMHVPCNAITHLHNIYPGHAYYNIIVCEHDSYKIQG